MKPEIHPEYVEAQIVCACGATYPTKSTKPLMRVEICSACHPFFTGKKKIVDTAGRVEKFERKYRKKQEIVPPEEVGAQTIESESE